MKKFVVTIYSTDHAGTLSNIIHLFLRGLRLRSLISKGDYIIENEPNK